MADKDDVETINPTMESEEGATAPETPSDEKPEEEKKDGIVQKVKDFLDSKIGVTIVGVVGMIMAIVSIVGVTTAYNLLKARVGDVSSVADNWNTKPVIDLQVRSISQGCPSGANWEEYTITQWAGASSMGCACPGSVSEDSSTSACNTNQTRAGCVDDEGFTSLKYNTFLPGGYIACALRGGNAAKGRPIPTSEDSCPSGTVLCGGTAGATWDANRATCQPSSSDCPVMFLDYIDTPSSAPAGVTLRTVPGTGKSFALYKTLPSSVPANFSSVGVGPLVNLPIAKDGKVCLASSKPIVSEEGRNLQNAYTSCSGGGDPRYKQVLQRPIFDLFNHTVQTSSSSVCVSNPNDRVSFSGGRSCGTGDSLCQRIITNSQCDKLEEYVQNSRTQGSWDVMYRSEVYWSSDCPVPRKEVEKNVSPINDALDLQYALMVVNILFNVLSGFLIPILLIYNAWAGDVPCVPYEGQAEKNLIKFIKVWFSAGSKIGKLIPMVIVLVLIRGMLGFLERLDKVSSEQCSDPTTTRSFEGISSTLQDAYNSNTRTALPMDVIGLLMALFNIYRELTDGVALKDK